MLKLKKQKTTAIINVVGCRKRTKEELSRSDKKDQPLFEILHKVIEVTKFGDEFMEDYPTIKSKSHVYLDKGDHFCEVKITKVDFNTYITVLRNESDVKKDVPIK